MKQKIKKFFTLNRRSNGGFTLVELVVVIAILAILAGAAVPAYSGYINKANEAADQQLLAALNTAYASACAAEGESHIGRKDVSGIKLDGGAIPTGYAMTSNAAIDSNFDLFFPDGQFKQFDKLLFNSTLGVFTENTAAALQAIVKAALEGSNFKGEAALKNVLAAVDQAGFYFSAGFSLDELVAQAPAEVQKAFGFGRFDLSEEQIYEMYVDGYAGWSDKEKEDFKNKLTPAEKNTLKGNAYVLHMANDASNRNAETVLGDVTNIMTALSKAGDVDNDKIVEYYKKVNNIGADVKVEPQDAKKALQLMYGKDVAVPAELVVAMGMSGVENTSGVTALSSMYAIAAGFYNSGAYTGSDIDPAKFAEFGTVVQIMNHPNFKTYLTGDGQNASQAMKDIDAYLSSMEYLSQSEFGDLTKTDLFATDGLAHLWGAVGSN